MYRTSNTLSENIRFKSAELLNRHLASAIDLHAQVKQAHWNVRGPAFIAIHELLDKVADVVEGYSDTIAERAATLGSTAEGTIQVAVKRSFLDRYEPGVANEKTHLTAVTAALATFGDSGRKAIDDGFRRPGHFRCFYRGVARHRLPNLAGRVAFAPVIVRDVAWRRPQTDGHR